MDLTETLKNFSIIIASLTAIYGIDSWRREFRGKKQAELAEETLSLFYQARDALSEIRSPWSHGGEGLSRKIGEKETVEETEAYNKAFVAFERYNSHIEMFNKLRSIRYRFMTQFGGESAKPFDELNRITSEILVSAKNLGELWARQNRYFRTEQQESQYFDRISEYEAIFWEGPSKEDPISPRLEQCISEIEKTCKPILLAKGTLFSALISKRRRVFRKNSSKQ